MKSSQDNALSQSITDIFVNWNEMETEIIFNSLFLTKTKTEITFISETKRNKKN